MISFKSFLAESRSTPLYHGTSLYRLKLMIKSGAILPKTVQRMEDTGRDYRGVSTTRNYNFAVKHAANIGEGGVAIIHFDQNKLTQKYKMLPYNYFCGWGVAREKERVGDKCPTGANEYEEFVVTTKNIPFSFVTQIDLSRNIRDLIEEIHKKYPHIKVKII